MSLHMLYVHSVALELAFVQTNYSVKFNTTWLSTETQLVPFIAGTEDALHSNNH
jgi:hypothetical protein